MVAELAPLIAKYGYAATFVGTLLEGETFLVLSGLAAHRGYLSTSLLVAVGAAVPSSPTTSSSPWAGCSVRRC
jgi:membrane protein DedA with SNARE-associated domain